LLITLSRRRKTSGMKKVQVGVSNKMPKFHMPSTHAEVDVINKLIKYKNLPKSIDLLVIKININNELINSKPCYHCIKFIIRKHREINIKNIYFSNENGEIEELNISKININEMYVSSGMRKKYITNT
jgi:hypothetical protein